MIVYQCFFNFHDCTFKPLYYRWYADIFVLFFSPQHLEAVQSFLNGRHFNMLFNHDVILVVWFRRMFSEKIFFDTIEYLNYMSRLQLRHYFLLRLLQFDDDKKHKS